MSKPYDDIIQWIYRVSKTNTLEELDTYLRTTEEVMIVYQSAHLITMDEYRELDGHLVTAYYQRYKDICVEEYRKADAEFLNQLRKGVN